MFNPIYKLTNSIVQMLTAIAESKAVIERAKILPQQELKLRRQALIRITHSSTAIEGNDLGISQVEALLARKKIDAPQRDIYEVQNYLRALKYIEKIEKWNNDKLIKDSDTLINISTELLEPSFAGTSMPDYKTFTFHRGSLNISNELKNIRC